MMESTNQRYTLSPQSKLILRDIIGNIWQRFLSGINKGNLDQFQILVMDKYKVILPDPVDHQSEQHLVSYLYERSRSVAFEYMEHFTTLVSDACTTRK